MRYLVPHVDDLLGRKLAEVTCLTMENAWGDFRDGGLRSAHAIHYPPYPLGGDATIC